MKLAKLIDGQWQRLTGVQALAVMCNTYQETRTYADGRDPEVAERTCEAYPVTLTESIETIAELVEGGVWGETELSARGLRPIVEFVPPDGKRIVPGSETRIIDVDGEPHEACDVEDEPPPPPPPTIEQRLAEAGLTESDIETLVDRAIEKRAGKGR